MIAKNKITLMLGLLLVVSGVSIINAMSSRSDDVPEKRSDKRVAVQGASASDILMQSQIIKVDTVAELQAAIGSNRTIVIQPDIFEINDLVTISGVQNLKITGKGSQIVSSADAGFSIDASRQVTLTNIDWKGPSLSPLKVLNSENIRLSHSTFQHAGASYVSYFLDLNGVTRMTIDQTAFISNHAFALFKFENVVAFHLKASLLDKNQMKEFAYFFNGQDPNEIRLSDVKINENNFPPPSFHRAANPEPPVEGRLRDCPFPENTGLRAYYKQLYAAGIDVAYISKTKVIEEHGVTQISNELTLSGLDEKEVIERFIAVFDLSKIFSYDDIVNDNLTKNEDGTYQWPSLEFRKNEVGEVLWIKVTGEAYFELERVSNKQWRIIFFQSFC